MASSRNCSKSRRKAKMRRNVSGSKKNRGMNNGIAKPEKKKTVIVDTHINLEKTIGNGLSHKINFNAKLVEEEAVHHKSLTNSCEHTIKNIQTSINLLTNSCGGKLDKKTKEARNTRKNELRREAGELRDSSEKRGILNEMKNVAIIQNN
ncbi:hypothetical protein Fot_57100 [Forsythia ovata]|uniref:Uncharacterized protein n=1 Tax=Forsythia ovata TaxID=205694 RepID=A0ABD1NWU6_9LAMI